jgi:exodeoxyribonuclease VII large subunit
MERAVHSNLERARRRLLELNAQLLRHEPRRLVQLRRLQLQEQRAQIGRRVEQMGRLVASWVSRRRQAWLSASAGITQYNFARLLALKQAELQQREISLRAGVERALAECRNRITQRDSLLAERSPLTVLNRGYSITRDAQGRIVRDAAQVSLGDDLSIRLAHGELGATVAKKS